MRLWQKHEQMENHKLKVNINKAASLVLLSRQTFLRKFGNICVRCAIMRIMMTEGVYPVREVYPISRLPLTI